MRPNCGEAVGNPAVGLVVVLGDLSRPALLDVPEKVFDLNKLCLRLKPNFGNHSCFILTLVPLVRNELMLLHFVQNVFQVGGTERACGSSCKEVHNVCEFLPKEKGG